MPSTSHNPAQTARLILARRVASVALVLTAPFVSAQEEKPQEKPAERARIRIELDPNNPEQMRQLLERELGGNARIQVRGNFQLGANAQGFGDFGADGVSEMEAAGLEGGTVKTDSEMEDLLKRAGEFATGGRYDLAVVLWQEVVDRSGDVVFTKDEWVRETLSNRYQRYRGITSEIERTLAELPAEGLDAYRLKADGEAKAVLRAAGAAGREAALGEVVRRYFLSSIGDDAAFELACLKLDRFEFLPAARLLSKVVREYPNPSVEGAELLVRLAVANGRIGDIEGARELMGQVGNGVLPEGVVAAVREDIELASERGSEGLAPGLAEGDEWRMKGGNPARNGAMPALPESFLAPGRELEVAWEQGFKLTLPDGWPTEPNIELDPYELSATGPTLGRLRNDDDPFGPNAGEEKEPVKRATLDEKWREGEWTPTGELLLGGGLLYFKTHYQIVCCEAESGAPRWLGFRNLFPLDRNSAFANAYRTNEPDTGKPAESVEIELFADRVHQGMCLMGDHLVAIEGPLSDFSEESGGEENLGNGGLQNRGFNRWGRIPSTIRTRNNRLVAYNARNGKLRWSRHGDDGQFNAGASVTFAGAPVPYGSLVLAPVNIDGALWVHAFALESGETLWRSYLCAEPGVCSAYSPVVIAVDGGDAYVASGTGLAFSVDAISGTLNWATRYPRAQRIIDTGTDVFARRGGWPPRSGADLLDGWDEDVVIPYGGVLLFAGSDSSQLIALDRRSGELAWETERKPFDEEGASTYVLGVHDGNVYVAGKETVRCYRILGGRFLWETKTGKSYARGMVTEEGIYIPQEASVLRLDPGDGTVTHTLPMATRDKEPVGNLFSDGKHLFAFGLKRVCALEAVEPAKGEGEAEPKAETKETSDENTETP